MSLEGELQYSLRVGDAVLLYAKEARGYVFSELTSSKHNSVAVTSRALGGSFREPRFDNVHVATFCVVVANKNKAQERLLELKKKIGKREMTTHQSNVLQGAKKAVEAELKENAAEQERLLGSQLVYGERIQLQHTLTGKYVRVNSTLTSRTENTSLRVELSGENSNSCVFKILPRYKVRSVGDVVRYQDQIKFESVMIEGQYLHCSMRPCGSVGFYVFEHCFEVNLSATESALTLIPHYRPFPHYHHKTFKANQSVRLFHREYECYVSAEGSFAESNQVVVEDVHCRRRKTDHGILKAPSTSANTFWQIEKESDPRSGEPLSWGERCRIRHMPTRLYLAVLDEGNNKYKVTLKERRSVGHAAAGQDLETVFALFPVIQEGDTVLFESYARIKHLATKTWLHLERGEHTQYRRKAFDPTAVGLEGLEWDGAELYMLQASETMNYDDAFTLEMVSQSLLDKFNYVAGIVPVLTSYLSQTGISGVVSAQDAYLVASALKDLARYISASSSDRENKDRQKLLRNLRVLEIIIEILGLCKQGAKISDHEREVCKACYLVIESYLKGDSRKNENYLARFIKFFQQQVGMDLNAEEVMIEMVEDNTAIVSKMASAEMEFMLKRLVDTGDARFLLFLSNLCVCDGRPIPSTQNTVLDELVRAHGKSVFFHLEVGGPHFYPEGEEGVVYFQRPGSTRWEPLLNIASRNASEEDEDFQFLDSQLLLFGKMCQGNNEHCINALDKEDLRYVTFQQALWCVSSPDLHPCIASKYVELIKVMFVDVGLNRAVLETLSLSFVYDEVVEDPYADTGGNEEEALTGVINIYFPDMKKWIFEYLSKVAEEGVVARHMEDNMQLAKVLEVLALLVKYGYYDDADDVEEVLRPLVKVMNGKTDLLSPKTASSGGGVEENDFHSSGRYKETQQNKAIFTVKERAVEVLDLVFNFRFYVRLQRFIFEFRQLRGDASPLPEATPSGRGLLSTVTTANPPMLLKTLMTPLNAPTPSNLHSSVMVGTVRERLKFLFSKSAYFFERSEYLRSSMPFPEILIDMTCYDSDELVQGSLHLLNRLFSAEASLFHSALQTQLLLTPKSKEVFNKIEEMLPNLRRLLSLDLRDDGRAEVIRILQTFTDMCQLPLQESEPHTQNQNILYNFGVLSDILDYVLEPANIIQREATPGHDADDGSRPAAMNETVYVKCFLFLKVFARRNPEVQRRLYNSMNDLLDIGVAVPYVAMVLTEVFTGGPEICLRVKEEQVERLFYFISEGGEGSADLLQTLQSMVKAEDLDLPIKRNQAFVIHYFSKTRDKFCDHLLGEGKKDYRWQLLTEAPEEDTNLQLLLSLTDLLASCAEGENLFIESVCQTIYKVEELLLILSHPRLSPERKNPFARFLIWVYLNTDGDKYQSGASSLSSDSNMWQYLEHLSTLLENIGIALRAVPDSERQWVREGMSVRARTTSKVTRTSSQRAARTTSRSIQYVTSDGGELKPGVLQYFVDGILPLLRYFYANLYEPPKSAEGEQGKQLRITERLFKNLLALCDVLMLYFTTEPQVRLYRSTVVTLVKFPTAAMRSAEIENMLENFDHNTREGQCARCRAREQYLQDYGEEITLNEEFDRFVTYLQQAYEGPNTAHAQTGSKYDTSYSEGDECLPLGPAFQEHVGLFLLQSRGGVGVGLPMVLTGGGDREVLRPETARLFTQLEISFQKLKDLDVTERQKQDELDIKNLQILRAIVYNEIMNIDTELREEDPSSYRRRCIHKVQPLQNKLQSFGNAVSRVVPLLSHPNEDIVREVLAFLKVMLYSGNRNVQRGFEHLLETREERLFITMKGLLQHAAVTYIERRTLLGQVTSRKATEEALLSGFSIAKKQDDSATASIKRTRFQESVSVVVELVEEKSGEYLPMETLRRSGEEEEDKVALVSSPSHSARKKSASGSIGRARISSRPAFDVLDLESSRTSGQGKDAEVAPYAAGVPPDALNVLKFQDSAHIKLALEVLGLMCDGQFRLVQNYLREQRDNIVTINLVGEVAVFAQHFYNDINQETMELVHLILQTLIEMCVGNFPNQEVIYNRLIVDVVNTILQLSIGDYHEHGFSYIEDLVNLKGSAVELIEAMLEETNHRSCHLAKEIAGSLDLAAIYDTVHDFFELMNDELVKAARYDDNAERGLFRAYHVILQLKDYGNDLGEWAEPPEQYPTLAKAFSYCKTRSKSIEVNYKNMDGDKILTKINFHLDPANDLREEVVEKVKWQVNRDSAEDKLRDFLEWMYALKKDTLHHRKLHQYWITKLLVMFPTQRYYILLFITLLLNLLVLITFSVPESRQNDAENATLSRVVGPIKPEVDFFFRRYLLFILGAVHLIFSLWMVVEYFVVNYPNFILPLPEFFYTLFGRFGLKKPERTYSAINIYGLRTMYVVLFLLASTLSLAFYGYFYALCLLHIIVNNDILQRVLRAVTQNGIALLWVAALGGVVLYIYAVISFAFLHESADNEADSNRDNDLFCDTLGQCFITVIRYGLIDNLGLVFPLVPAEFRTSGLRILFDVSFFIIVTTIGLNIVFGIIVDTFSELRDERFRTETDKKSFCFICSLPNHEFERRAKGFDDHVKKDHNMWKYIYYSIYLDTKDTSDHTALEKFVYEMIGEGKIEFFPVLQARCLETEEDETVQQLEVLSAMVTSVLERFKEEEHERVVRSKKQEQERWEEKVLKGRGSLASTAIGSVEESSVY